MKLQEVQSHQRQIVYFVNDAKYDGLHYYDQGKDLLSSEDVKILPISRSEEFLDTYAILGGGIPSNRMMLLISPSNHLKYAEISESAEYFALYKLTNILRLCQLLGAKNVTINDIKKESGTRSVKTNTGANGKGVSLTVETENKSSYKLKEYIGYTSSFSGGKVNYEVAISFLLKSRLAGDLFLSNLVEMRDPEFSENEILTINQNIKLSSTSDKIFKLLATLQFPVGGGNFELNTQTAAKKNYSLDIEINF